MMRPSVLPSGMKLDGEVEGEGDLVVLGSIDGDVRITGSLVIEATGTVRGHAVARMVVVRGVLIGDADATDTVRAEPGARMVGDARAPRVNIVEGALLRGRIELTGEGEPRVPRLARGPASRSSAGSLLSPQPTSPGYASSPGTVPAAAVIVAAAPHPPPQSPSPKTSGVQRMPPLGRVSARTDGAPR